ncbi:response regulator [Lysinibacillus sp. NPDC093688]|uniref:response regulator n=1 Tax=Lysinibacillus sp. NPDC093688 TaxID=3390577 RepID=UPI003D00EA31
MVLDDHIAIGEGTKAILKAELNCHADVFTDPYLALQQLTKAPYDVYLVDFNLPDTDGLEFIEKIINIHPEAIAIIYTGYNIERYITDLLEKGVCGFVSKSDSRKQLIDTINYALEEKIIMPLSLIKQLNSNFSKTEKSTRLTEREQKILDLVKDGLPNKTIAMELSLSQRTIEKNLTSIFSKLNVETRAEAAIKWIKQIS